LPRRTIQQREIGNSIELSHLTAGDLLFVTGYTKYFIDNSSDDVGHVAIATGEGNIIHAIYRSIGKGIFEHSIDFFLNVKEFRGARRVISSKIVTFITPPNREVETSDDVKWIILQNLK